MKFSYFFRKVTTANSQFSDLNMKSSVMFRKAATTVPVKQDNKKKELRQRHKVAVKSSDTERRIKGRRT